VFAQPSHTPRDVAARRFRERLGGKWADGRRPELLDREAIIFCDSGRTHSARAAGGSPKGGRVVCAGNSQRRHSELYRFSWEERQLIVVANLTRQVKTRLSSRRRHRIEKPLLQTTPYPLQRASKALADLRAGGRFQRCRSGAVERACSNIKSWASLCGICRHGAVFSQGIAAGGVLTANCTSSSVRFHHRPGVFKLCCMTFHARDIHSLYPCGEGW